MTEDQAAMAWAMFAAAYLQGCKHPYEESAQYKDEGAAAACADRMLDRMKNTNWGAMLTRAKRVGDW